MINGQFNVQDFASAKYDASTLIYVISCDINVLAFPYAHILKIGLFY